MITKQDVELAYLLLLGRTAEPGAADYWIENGLKTPQLVQSIMGSDEYRKKWRTSIDHGAPMRAIIHEGVRQTNVTEINRPEPQPGTVVIKISTVGICGTDLSMYRHDQNAQSLPQGHEYAGTIVEVGDGVPKARIGQRVTADSFINAMCGHCAFCAAGLPFHCVHKATPFRTGGFGEYVRVKDSATFDLPEAVDDALGALVEPLAVAIHAVRRLGIEPGMSGVVIGAGSIGLACVAAALDAGAKQVFVVAKHEFQGDLAKAIGAAGTLPMDIDSALDEVLKNLPYGFDFAIEAVGGSLPTLDQACKLVRPQGSIGVVGAFDPGFKGLHILEALTKEVTIFHSNCYGYLDGKHDFEVAIDLLARKGDQLRKLITHTFPMSNAVEAFRVADDKQSGAVKVQIRP